MFSKSLFKQSCKANGMMWLIITFAVCFMLSCVMLISGSGNVSTTKNAIQNTIIEDEVNSLIQDKGINYYEIGNAAMEHFDTVYVASYKETAQNLALAGTPTEQITQTAGMAAYATAAKELGDNYYPALIEKLGYAADSTEGKEIYGILFYVLNPMQEDGTYMFDAYYTEHGEETLHYTNYLETITSEMHADDREKYVMNRASAFLAGNMVGEESVNKLVEALSEYGVTAKQYEEFGFTDYDKVHDIAESAVVNYRADLEYRLDNMKDGETTESVKAEVADSVSGSFLSTLPQEVSDALGEIGQMDMYGTLVGTIFFKMAGLLLPIIYMIMTANALIAGQVDSGSMAYILSSSTKRRSVTFTQAMYLILSILLMFVLTCVTSIVCLNCVDVDTGLTWQKLILINLGAFLCMFAMSGICFLASCWFDRSKRSMALGGGLSMFFLVATMLGLFGTDIMPSIIRMKALNYFNYASLITLLDTDSILAGTDIYLWKFAILLGIGLLCYVIGAVRFRKKDLPL